ncbi:fibronectin type III domain-containing protein [Actinoplanes derwentensis]|uniref:fibronectin type III domain-containing protein n=1 Tax=Actinoplanes derwentensis TaxID=113562 RepID=UPI0012FD1D2D|nr:tetratricopeptide repeat protein [Actinoplanes derwentensis]
MLDRARSMIASGQFEAAQVLLERTVEVGREKLGEDEPDVLSAQRELAGVYLRTDDPMAARRVLEDAYAAGQWRLGDSDPLMLHISHDLGVVAQELGNKHEARKAFGRVLANGPAVLGDGHEFVAQARGYLGEEPSGATVRPEIAPSPAPAPPADSQATPTDVPNPVTPDPITSQTDSAGTDGAAHVPTIPQPSHQHSGQTTAQQKAEPDARTAMERSTEMLPIARPVDSRQADTGQGATQSGHVDRQASAQSGPAVIRPKVPEIQAQAGYGQGQAAQSGQTGHAQGQTAQGGQTGHAQGGHTGHAADQHQHGGYATGQGYPADQQQGTYQGQQGYQSQQGQQSQQSQQGQGYSTAGYGQTGHPGVWQQVPAPNTGWQQAPVPNQGWPNQPQVPTVQATPYPAQKTGGRAVAIGLTAVATLVSALAVVALVVVLADRSQNTATEGDQTPAPTGPVLAGEPPTDVTLDDRGVEVNVTWRDPTGGKNGFIVSMAREGQQLRPVAPVGPGTTSSLVNGLNPDLEYCFAVVAVYSTKQFASSKQVCTERQ